MNFDRIKKTVLKTIKNNDLRERALTMHRNGRTYVQIAEALDLPESTVRNLLKPQV